MKTCVKTTIWAILVTIIAAEAVRAGDTSLAVLDEKVLKLTALVEDLQVRQQQTQKDIERLQAEVTELRRAAGGVSAADLKALDDRITAVDNARQRDQKVLIEQVAKELAGAGTKPVNRATGTEHVVAKGETLSGIAKANGVTVADLKKANNLTSDNLNVGQKLTIPK